MLVERFHTAGLNTAAYLIVCGDVAAVVDPQRDITPYLQAAAAQGARITYVLLTHLHSDFVSGHLEVAAVTGAVIVTGTGTKTRFTAQAMPHGSSITMGQCSIQVLHTPGHTAESVCYLLCAADGRPTYLFSGDTLLADAIGRPDVTEVNTDMNTLMHELQQSLQQLLLLPDAVRLCGTHGAAGEQPVTLAQLKEVLPALYETNLQQFTNAVMQQPQAHPAGRTHNLQYNRNGYPTLQELQAAATAYDVAGLQQALKDATCIVLDTRPATTFTQGFIPGSVFIGLENRFCRWAGALLAPDSNLLLVCEPGTEAEVINLLARVGLHKVQGYLAGGFESWRQAGAAMDMIIDVEADELAMDLPFDDNLIVVDVRQEPEFAAGHVKDAVHLPLSEINDPGLLANIEDTDNLYLHSTTGYRSVIAASFMKRQGFHNLRNIMGGWEAIRQQRIETVKEKAGLN